MKDLISISVNEKKRMKCFDILKAIAIFCVVFYHTKGFVINVSTNNIWIQRMEYFIGCFLSICVPLFFMVNGALLFNKEINLKKHVLKTLKLFSLVYLWSFILMILQSVFLGYKFSTIQFIKDVFYTRIGYNNYIWYLMQLALLYLIFPFLKLLFDYSKKYFLFFLLICFAFTYFESVVEFVNCVLTSKLGESNIVTQTINNAYYALKNFYDPTIKSNSYSITIFMIGGYLYYLFNNYKETIFNYKTLINILSPLVLLVMLILSYIYCKIVIEGDNVWNGYDSIFTLIICFLLFVWTYANENNKRDIKPIIFISKNTFGIYVLHIIVLSVIYKVVAFFVDLSVIPTKLFYFIPAFVISLFLSFLFSKIKWIKNVFNL